MLKSGTTLMKIVFLIITLLFSSVIAIASEEITPYKFTEEDYKNGMPTYDIPSSSRFTAKRLDAMAPDIVYYLSVPKKPNFPIAILCGGSSSKENIISIIHFHRYVLKEFQDLDIAVLTAEQWGVDGKKVDSSIFMEHYTRTQRLNDYRTIIKHLKLTPPKGWNGKFIFLGVSEGGPIVTTLTTEYPDSAIATINWSGAGEWSWRDELWVFIEAMNKQTPWHVKFRSLLPKFFPFYIESNLPNSRKKYDKIMDQTLENPHADKEFMGMTYKYHADALTYPAFDYKKILTPYLVVAGAQDSCIHSTDAFVEKAKKADVKLAYLRIDDMDHYVRKRPDVIKQTFEWLKKQSK